MEWLFFQSQSHRPAHVRREVFVAPSPHPLSATELLQIFDVLNSKSEIKFSEDVVCIATDTTIFVVPLSMWSVAIDPKLRIKLSNSDDIPLTFINICRFHEH